MEWPIRLELVLLAQQVHIAWPSCRSDCYKRPARRGQTLRKVMPRKFPLLLQKEASNGSSTTSASIPESFLEGKSEEHSTWSPGLWRALPNSSPANNNKSHLASWRPEDAPVHQPGAKDAEGPPKRARSAEQRQLGQGDQSDRPIAQSPAGCHDNRRPTSQSVSMISQVD